jgi:DNA-binding protein HU-beta
MISGALMGQEGSMNKQDVVAKIAKDTGLTKTAAAGVIASLIESITKSLKKGDPVSFVGFGTFKTSNRKARKARNPQTGAPINIPKRRVPRFTAGKALKQAVK